jgi:diguanylate cyclase (GGDEF)-like protein/PAS domain S-box-containing protein
LRNFFQQHLDYVFFVYGLGFVLIAAVCVVIPKESARGAPWKWLGLFGLTHGFAEWLEILAIDLTDTTAFGAVRVAAMALSFVFLCEFGRKTLGKLQFREPGRWIHVLLLALAATGAIGGVASVQATTRYALALTGGLWAAWAMYQMDKKDERSRGALAAAAIGLAGYAVAAGAIVPQAPFFPASVLNADWFYSAVGVPVQLFRAAFGVFIAIALWTYSVRVQRVELSEADNKGVALSSSGMAIILAMTLVAGWRFAEFASESSDGEARDMLRVQVGTAATGFPPALLASLGGTAVDEKDAPYRHLREQLQAVSRADPVLRSARLLLLRGGKILEAMSVGTKDRGRAQTGVDYERPPGELLQAFSPGKVTTLGPYGGGSGDLVSAFAPIRDPRTNVVAGVVGIDIGADDWERSVAGHRLTAILITLLLVLLIIYFFIARERMWRLAQLTKRSETRLAAAQRMAQIGSWSYDRWSGRITWSDEMYRIFGRDPKLGALSDPRQLKAYTDPQDWPRLRSNMRQAFEEGADYHLEFRVVRADGSLRQVEATAHASRGDNGKVVALTGTVQDISARRQAEQALRESEVRFRSLTEMSSDFYWESDAEHRLRQRASADRKLSTVSVFQQGAQIGERRWEIPYLSPDEAGWQAHRAVLDAHQPFRGFELSRLGADGSERHISISGDPVFDEAGAFAGYRGVGTDITARKRAEQALRESVEKLRLFADNVPAITVSWDENLRCRFANKAFAAVFGLAVEDVVGKHLRELYGEDVFREVEDHFVQVLRGQAVTYHRTHKLANGESRYLEVKLLPHFGGQGKVVGCYAVTTDITEHKLTEERIQRVAHHDSLTGLPNRLLFNDRLSQAMSLAKRDSRQFALLYLDLDKFKPVNDTLGHTAGDELLQGVAARIRREVRESDTVARVGGDEFTVILPGIARREDAETVARKIVAAVAAPFQLGSQKQSVNIGTSIGIALYPADARDPDALVKAADAAMYSAKQAGNSFRSCAA